MDVSAVASWEAGRYLPRDVHRAALAKLLDVDLTAFLSDDKHARGISAASVHGTEIGRLLAELIEGCQKQLTILRVSSPFVTRRHQMVEFRQIADRRLLDHSLDVKIIEVFYGVQRLQEVFSNIFRYDGCSYSVKTFIPPTDGVVPGIDTYIFDRSVAVLGSYWPTPITDERPVLQIAGEPLVAFLREHWNGLWRCAISLNPSGARDLSAIQELSPQLGIPESGWREFVEQSKRFSLGDNVPPAP